MTTEERVLASLSDGRWHVMDSLAESIGVSRREMQETVENLRLTGHPIVGGPAGIKLTDDSLELRAYVIDSYVVLGELPCIGCRQTVIWERVAGRWYLNEIAQGTVRRHACRPSQASLGRRAA